MEQLKEKISDLINEYFDKKTENVDWRYDISAEEKAKRLVQECIEDVLQEVEGYDNDIDEHLEEFEEMYSNKLGQYEEDRFWDDYFRTRDLLTERR